MSFDGTEGSMISVSDAAAMTANYRSANPNGKKGHFFGKSNINSLLNQTGAKGLRIYYGIDGTTGKQELIVVAVDSSENDILSSAGPLVLDRSIACPPNCGTSNSLNS
jgi:hypothetical protein